MLGLQAVISNAGLAPSCLCGLERAPSTFWTLVPYLWKAEGWHLPLVEVHVCFVCASGAH